MPIVTNHKNLKLHHNTWVVRIVIPKDIRAYFPAKDNKGNRIKGKFLAEYLQSTGKKKHQLEEALELRDGIVADFNIRKRHYRSGDFDPVEDQAKVLQDRWKKLVGSQEELDKQGEAQGVHGAGGRIKIDEFDEAFEQACDIHISGGASAVHKQISKMWLARKLNAEGRQPNEMDALRELAGADGVKRVEHFLAVVKGLALTSRLDDYMKIREVTKTHPRHQQKIRSTIKEFSKEFPLVENVNYVNVKAWTRRLEDKDLASKTIKSKVSALNLYWTYLEELGIADRNQKPPFQKLGITSHVKHVRQAWTFEDSKRIVEEETSHSKNEPVLKDLIIIALLTGMRLGEICKLKTTNVTTVKDIRVLNIPLEITKTTSGVRNVPLSSKLAPVIDRLTEQSKDGYIIPYTGRGNQYNDRSDIWSKRFGSHKNKLEYQKYVDCFHGMRHSANAYLSKEGVTVVQRQCLLGWASEDGESRSMAVAVYGKMDIEYPLAKRKVHAEILCDFYSFI